MIVKDAKGNELLEVIAVPEERAENSIIEVIVAKHSSVAALPTTVHLTFDPTEGFRSAF
ncbi:MAG: hypothetical protein IJ147_07995 [Lachnospiraceae bacterium]|nr:hypothetical protein [Lachnospiraceae bacterium]